MYHTDAPTVWFRRYSGNTWNKHTDTHVPFAKGDRNVYASPGIPTVVCNIPDNTAITSGIGDNHVSTVGGPTESTVTRINRSPQSRHSGIPPFARTSISSGTGTTKPANGRSTSSNAISGPTGVVPWRPPSKANPHPPVAVPHMTNDIIPCSTVHDNGCYLHGLR